MNKDSIVYHDVDTGKTYVEVSALEKWFAEKCDGASETACANNTVFDRFWERVAEVAAAHSK